MKDIINISQAAAMLGLNIQTLRRWDVSGKLRAERHPAGGSRFYHESGLADFLMDNFKYCQKMAERWSIAKSPIQLPGAFYCQDRSVFKARLSRFESDLKNNPLWQENYSLIVAIAGEIGNNSFDHNLGNWPDVLGIFFGYSLKEKTVILADRGQGILATLQRVAPDLTTHQGALKAAFTEILSGRAPENRGNGLKFVKQVVKNNDFSLFFQSGDAMLLLNNNGGVLPIDTGGYFLRGCFAKLNF